MWFLVSNLKETEIVEDDKCPSMGGKWTSRSIGYASKEELLKGEGVLEESCKCCGQLVSTKYIQSLKDKLTKVNLCFSCNFWQEKLEAYQQEPQRFIISNHHLYAIGEEDSKSSFRGCGGAKFIFLRGEDEVITSTNIWSLGAIPEHFWDKLPNNALQLPSK